ncbi:MAG: RHS repeat domain-containing protein [Clostridiaceae bacterium]
MWETFEYNSDGTLSKAITSGMAYSYSYTEDSMLKSKSTCGKTLISYDYDKNGNTLAITDISGKSTIYNYDVANRVKAIKDNKQNTLATYDYNGNNDIKSIAYGNGVKTDYNYDGDGNVESLVTISPTGEVLVDYNYAYDLNGNRLQKVSSKAQSYYSYDSLNRLSSAKYNTPTKSIQESFTYDKVGNRLEKITNDGIEKYKYNAKNQLIELEKSNQITKFNYDKQGNLLEEQSSEGTASYSYNSFNQTIKAVTKEGNTLVNKYDAEGLRFEIEENEKLTKFIFNKDSIIAELDENDDVISRFSRGFEIVSGEINNNWYYYHQDEQGSTSSITNEDGKVENSYFYDAFGVVLESTENVHNRITYTGQQFDGVTRQYYLRARFYNPVIGRFTQEDVYRGDGLNLYAYCRNNPVIYYDPSGYNKSKVDLCTEKGRTSAEEVIGKDVYGPHYEEALRLHKENPDYFPDPDKSTIVQGEALKKAREDYNTLVSQGKLNKGHHIEGLAFGGENKNHNITDTGESTIKRSYLEDLDLSFYSKAGYGKKGAKVLKIHKTKSGTYVFGNNPDHTAATNFQNKVLRWQRKNKLRK